MRPVLSRQEIREFDRVWIERGVPGMVLMENAGRGAAHLIGLKARPRPSGEKPRQGSSVVGSCVRCADERALSGLDFLILAGPGNNGGDGFVVARHLAARAANVEVWCLVGRDKLKGDALSACLAMEAAGVRLVPVPAQEEWQAAISAADVVIDALLGTGANRLIEGRLAALIEQVNVCARRVIALDVPSGLDAQTGAVLGVGVRAAHTVTFAHLKRGLLTTHGRELGGDITVSHIGVPSELPSSVGPSAWLMEESDLRRMLEARSPVAHKGTAGRVAVLAGSPGTVGAARLCCRAALRAGAGLVTVLSDGETTRKLEEEVVEVMTQSWDDEERTSALFGRAGAFVVGPGLGQAETARRMCERAYQSGKPVVVDADALQALGQDSSVLSAAEPRLSVLTPHPGEAGALLGCSAQDVESDRFAAAQQLAGRFDSVVVLKGPRTIVCAPDQAPVVSAFGSPVLATGGSGDVLAGILGAMLAGASTTAEVFARSQLAVALHARAGERWQAKHGDRGLLASELGDLVVEVIGDLVRADP